MSDQLEVLDKINEELKAFEKEYNAKYLLVAIYPYPKESPMGNEHVYKRFTEKKFDYLIKTVTGEMEKIST